MLLFALFVFWSYNTVFTHPKTLYEFTQAQLDLGPEPGDNLNDLVSSILQLRDRVASFSSFYKPMVAIVCLMLVLRLFTFLGETCGAVAARVSRGELLVLVLIRNCGT